MTVGMMIPGLHLALFFAFRADDSQVSGLCHIFFYFFSILYNGFHSAPRETQCFAFYNSRFFPLKNFILKLHGQFLVSRDSRIDSICHISCETSQIEWHLLWMPKKIKRKKENFKRKKNPVLIYLNTTIQQKENNHGGVNTFWSHCILCDIPNGWISVNPIQHGVYFMEENTNV